MQTANSHLTPTVGFALMPNQTHRTEIVAAMTARGVSQSELARLTGISQPSISDYVRGAADFNGKTLDRVFVALHLEIRKRRGR